MAKVLLRTDARHVFVRECRTEIEGRMVFTSEPVLRISSHKLADGFIKNHGSSGALGLVARVRKDLKVDVGNFWENVHRRISHVIEKEALAKAGKAS